MVVAFRHGVVVDSLLDLVMPLQVPSQEIGSRRVSGLFDDLLGSGCLPIHACDADQRKVVLGAVVEVPGLVELAMGLAVARPPLEELGVRGPSDVLFQVREALAIREHPRDLSSVRVGMLKVLDGTADVANIFEVLGELVMSSLEVDAVLFSRHLQCPIPEPRCTVELVQQVKALALSVQPVGIMVEPELHRNRRDPGFKFGLFLCKPHSCCPTCHAHIPEADLGNVNALRLDTHPGHILPDGGIFDELDGAVSLVHVLDRQIVAEVEQGLLCVFIHVLEPCEVVQDPRLQEWPPNKPRIAALWFVFRWVAPRGLGLGSAGITGTATSADDHHFGAAHVGIAGVVRCGKEEPRDANPHKRSKWPFQWNCALHLNAIVRGDEQGRHFHLAFRRDSPTFLHLLKLIQCIRLEVVARRHGGGLRLSGLQRVVTDGLGTRRPKPRFDSEELWVHGIPEMPCRGSRVLLPTKLKRVHQVAVSVVDEEAAVWLKDAESSNHFVTQDGHLVASRVACDGPHQPQRLASFFVNKSPRGANLPWILAVEVKELDVSKGRGNGKEPVVDVQEHWVPFSFGKGDPPPGCWLALQIALFYRAAHRLVDVALPEDHRLGTSRKGGVLHGITVPKLKDLSPGAAPHGKLGAGQAEASDMDVCRDDVLGALEPLNANEVPGELHGNHSTAHSAVEDLPTQHRAGARSRGAEHALASGPGDVVQRRGTHRHVGERRPIFGGAASFSAGQVGARVVPE
mmetsp:Transcript_2126/g.6135  ORF Transcript_2126/g.6135 Transcript_2126/m.6135 type:complete len:741 (-) Transcript_2126:416-2638(-)